MRITRNRARVSCSTTTIPLPTRECLRTGCPMEKELPLPRMAPSSKLSGLMVLIPGFCDDFLQILCILLLTAQTAKFINLLIVCWLKHTVVDKRKNIKSSHQ
jgi:hypothetical protein